MLPDAGIMALPIGHERLARPQNQIAAVGAASRPTTASLCAVTAAHEDAVLLAYRAHAQTPYPVTHG